MGDLVKLLYAIDTAAPATEEELASVEGQQDRVAFVPVR